MLSVDTTASHRVTVSVAVQSEHVLPDTTAMAVSSRVFRIEYIYTVKGFFLAKYFGSPLLYILTVTQLGDCFET